MGAVATKICAGSLIMLRPTSSAGDQHRQHGIQHVAGKGIMNAKRASRRGEFPADAPLVDILHLACVMTDVDTSQP